MQEYLEKYKESDAETLQAQWDRLGGMTDLQADLQQWVYRRMRIVKQLQARGGAGSASDAEAETDAVEAEL